MKKANDIDLVSIYNHLKHNFYKYHFIISFNIESELPAYHGVLTLLYI